MASADPETSDPTAEPDYLEAMSEHLLASTDMLIVVEGTELPCHKQVMAVHSKVFAGMAELVSSHGHDAPLRIEEPFKNQRLADMRLLLLAIYRPELLDTSLDSYTMGALLELAHQLDMPALTLRIKRILLPSSRYLEERTYSKTPPGNCTDLMRELTKAGEAPANVDAALIWLRYCQRFDLDDDTVRACELAVACHFLWAGRFRAAELQAIGGISLFRVSQAYARTQFALTNGCTHSTLAEAQLRMAAWDARMSESLVQSGKNGRWDVWSQKAPS